MSEDTGRIPALAYSEDSDCDELYCQWARSRLYLNAKVFLLPIPESLPHTSVKSDHSFACFQAAFDGAA